MELPEDDRQVVAARQAIMERAPCRQSSPPSTTDGYWVKPGAGYSPKYQGTVWQLMFLAHLAADGSDERVARACEYVLTHSRAKNGAFSAYADVVPSAPVDCLNGNLIHAFYRLGWGSGRARAAGRAPALRCRSPRSTSSARPNAKLPCAWGAVKALLAFSAIPPAERTSEVKAAIEEGVDFLLSRNLAVADYPCRERVSSNWQKFGFPLSYTSNVLEALQALAGARLRRRAGADGRHQARPLEAGRAGSLEDGDQPERQDVGRHRGRRASRASG